MAKRTAANILAVLLLTLAPAALGVPEQPRTGVLDIAEAWPLKKEKELEQTHRQLLTDYQYAVFFVSVGSLDESSLEGYGQEVCDAWLQDRSGAVFVVDAGASKLGVVVNDKGEIKPSPETIEEVRLYLFGNRKSREQTVILASAAEALTSNLPRAKRKAGPDAWLELLRRHRQMAWTTIAVTALLLLGYFLRMAHHTNFFGHPRRFPVAPVEPRLGGTASGGHGIMIDFGAPKSAPAEPVSGSDY